MGAALPPLLDLSLVFLVFVEDPGFLDTNAAPSVERVWVVLSDWGHPDNKRLGFYMCPFFLCSVLIIPGAQDPQSILF